MSAPGVSVALAGLALALGAVAPAAAREPPRAPARAAAVSSNWAGYAISGRGARRSFTRVIGAWGEPRAVYAARRATYAAFWVGLGGLREGSKGLEQIGTRADCSRGGRASYAAVGPLAAYAEPSSLSGAGSSFAVTWDEHAAGRAPVALGAPGELPT